MLSIYKNDCKFINVPLSAYEFTIGNDQVIENYLRVRKGRGLRINEIKHFEKVIRVIEHMIEIQDLLSVYCLFTLYDLIW
ncbi:hypothetical protein F9Y90_05285 (plasmid) [Borrelia miyamotoi]|uniref:Uncharacterized protein n=1 Tax=Borrelia miyamotoi TaxID=47466 RepID=A0A5P8ARR7_9SPIR|nr:hypothetical protein [Borrelia miyamotoi]QFP42513.1 hypothetical protein F9Y90_05285 [Borrelia miyamotoi]WAZ72889.1 hypothetical protein O5404_07700 [Borrelia miyamotoi]